MTCSPANALFFVGVGVLLGWPLLFSLYFVLLRVTQPKPLSRVESQVIHQLFQEKEKHGPH